jgi:hypothetical protein
MEKERRANWRYLTNIAAIQNINLFTDTIFFWSQVK